MTAFNNKTGGFQLTPVGRVQTPTLAILAEREEKIHAFKSRARSSKSSPISKSKRAAIAAAGFAKILQRTAMKTRAPNGFGKRRTAEEIKARCLGKTGIATEERKPTTQAPPLALRPDELAAGRERARLQRQAHAADRAATLREIQGDYLSANRFALSPGRLLATVNRTLAKIQDPTLAKHARKVLDKQWVKPSKRIFNNAKISDHFAIVPSGAGSARPR